MGYTSHIKSLSESKAQFKVIPLKMVYYPDFFQTWHKCQPYIGHSKTAIKRWGHLIIFATCARNSGCFFLVAHKMFKTLATIKNFYFITKTRNLTRLLVWAFFFQLTNLRLPDLEKCNITLYLILFSGSKCGNSETPI